MNSLGEITLGKYKEDTKMNNRIIEHKLYIGILEQGKTTQINDKSTRILDVSKDDWIVIKDSQAPLISNSIFELSKK